MGKSFPGTDTLTYQCKECKLKLWIWVLQKLHSHIFPASYANQISSRTHGWLDAYVMTRVQVPVLQPHSKYLH